MVAELTLAAPTPRPWWRWLLLAAAVIALDLATKAWIVALFREGQELPVTSFFSLVLAYNTGAAFSGCSRVSRSWRARFSCGC